MTYQLLTDALSSVSYGATRFNLDGTATSFPFDPANTDYQAYLAWLDDGNTPEPAPIPESAPMLTTEQKLEAAGLTVAELKELFGLS